MCYKVSRQQSRSLSPCFTRSYWRAKQPGNSSPVSSKVIWLQTKTLLICQAHKSHSTQYWVIYLHYSGTAILTVCSKKIRSKLLGTGITTVSHLAAPYCPLSSCNSAYLSLLPQNCAHTPRKQRIQSYFTLQILLCNTVPWVWDGDLCTNPQSSDTPP